jgi:hypothetical protein
VADHEDDGDSTSTGSLGEALAARLRAQKSGVSKIRKPAVKKGVIKYDLNQQDITSKTRSRALLVGHNRTLRFPGTSALCVDVNDMFNLRASVFAEDQQAHRRTVVNSRSGVFATQESCIVFQDVSGATLGLVPFGEFSELQSLLCQQAQHISYVPLEEDTTSSTKA